MLTSVNCLIERQGLGSVLASDCGVGSGQMRVKQRETASSLSSQWSQ